MKHCSVKDQMKHLFALCEICGGYVWCNTVKRGMVFFKAKNKKNVSTTDKSRLKKKNKRQGTKVKKKTLKFKTRGPVIKC